MRISRFLTARLFAVLLVTATAGSLLQAPTAAAQADEQAVLNVVTALFDAMRSRDAAALGQLFLPEARLGTSAVDSWIEQVQNSTAYLDEITFDETVLVDGDLAMAWTPYNLFVDDSFHHCGVDLFVMRRSEGQWKILQLNDTRRTENCDPMRRGD